jgi:nicotinate-nucleotide--dimethylbenzimidazole phosphoribosyltransferase
VDKTAIAKKIAIVKKALALHGSSVKHHPASAPAKLGGTEIAGLVGAILEASDRDMPVLVDGFIVTVAALVAASLSPNVCRVLFLSTMSAGRDRLQQLVKSRALPKRTVSLCMKLLFYQ